MCEALCFFTLAATSLPLRDASNYKSYIACWLNKVTLASDTFLRYSPVLENIAF